MLVELLEKRVVNRMVSDRKSLGIVERRPRSAPLADIPRPFPKKLA